MFGLNTRAFSKFPTIFLLSYSLKVTVTIFLISYPRFLYFYEEQDFLLFFFMYVSKTIVFIKIDFF